MNPDTLAEQIEYEAAIASPPGQRDRLLVIAAEVRKLKCPGITHEQETYAPGPNGTAVRHYFDAIGSIADSCYDRLEK